MLKKSLPRDRETKTQKMAVNLFPSPEDSYDSFTDDSHTDDESDSVIRSIVLKLLVDEKSSKVLFAEADKNFVDFLFSTLALPLGTVTKLLKQNDEVMSGSLVDLYASIESLSKFYFLSNQSKQAVLHPKVTLSSTATHIRLLSSEDQVGDTNTKLYMCGPPRGGCTYPYITGKPQACPACGYLMNVEAIYLDPPASSDAGSDGGYVKEVVTYLVMDDLAVRPMSSISSLTLLDTFNIKDVGSLKELTVTLGMAEGLKLLQASLTSKTVLTDVFLRQTGA